MRKPKQKQVSLRGDQLMSAGDIITLMDEGIPIKCKVISCLGANDGSCFANLEILEGPRKGNRIQTSLVAREGGPE
ncbi:MAG: hypothetical protein ACP5U1_10945 [Desulfomonilaceae bacterium]